MSKGKSVFISYSSHDTAFVGKLIGILDDIGVSYWKAPEMIPAGSSYAREIPQAIRECEVFLLVLSKRSQLSIWVEKEIDSAIYNHKTIIPFQIDSVPLSETYRFYLNNVQMISYADNPKKAEEELKAQLTMLLNLDMVDDKSDDTAKNQTPKTAKRKVRSLSMNRVPIECEYCGGELLRIGMGTYECKNCGRENYDDFQTIRNYLESAGATSATRIERDTGVPRRIIDYFFREEYLEIPKHSSVRISCSKCGAPIRTGTLCDNCKNINRVSDIKPKKDVWHTPRRY